LALGTTTEPDNISESSAENRDNILGAASLAAIKQARNSLLRVPSETVVQYQEAPVDHPRGGMPEVITFPTPGDEFASSEGSQQSRPLQALASDVNSAISDITGLQVAALHLPTHQHIPGGNSDHSDHQAASAQLHLQPIPIQQFQVGTSMNAYGGIVGNLHQQPGFFVAPTTYPGTMMMMMFPMSQQITGETQPTVFAMPNIMLPLQQSATLEPSGLGPVRQSAITTMGTSPSTVRLGKVVNLFLDFDSETLTEYQCLLRKQIELFEAGPEDIQASAQGRNSPILLGQVGIRCRYCATVPIHSRPRGFAYYSRTVDGMYQVAQNMSKLHFCKTCRFIPRDLQISLVALQQVNRRAAGGKEYWAEGLRVLGVYEDGKVMRFRNSALGEPCSEEEKMDTNQTCNGIHEQGISGEGVTDLPDNHFNEAAVWDG
jgi:hypothetical protein